MPPIPISDFGLFLFVIMSGYVAAAAIASGLRLLTPDGAAGLLRSAQGVRQVAGVVAVVLAGPSLVFEGLQRAAPAGAGGIAAALAVSALWSFVNGLFLLLCPVVLMH